MNECGFEFLSKNFKFQVVLHLPYSDFVKVQKACTSNNMFGLTIWYKLPQYIFENFEISRVKQGQFQHFQKSRE